MDRPSLPTIRYWMTAAIERDLHLSPPQAAEARAALQECLRKAECCEGLADAAFAVHSANRDLCFCRDTRGRGLGECVWCELRAALKKADGEE